MIEPDTKDWTWVLRRACPECGFDASRTETEAVPGLVRWNASRWGELYRSGRIRPGRPDPGTWSSLEYAAHVRDVYRLYGRRITLMVQQDDPLYGNWDQDTTAVEDRYDEQEPAAVIDGLAEAAEDLAAMLEILPGDHWDRPGRRSDGASFTVGTISRYMIHDPVHHVWDVERTSPG